MTEGLSLTMPLWEIAARATAVYLALVFLLRIIPKRNAGHISPNDLLTLIVIGGMATDAIMGGSTSIGDLLLMIVMVLGWSYMLDFLEHRLPFFRWVFRDRETSLIEDGRMLRRNMRREMVTEEELLAVLRKEGIEDVSAVQMACMEADGEISVVKRRGSSEARV